MDTQVTPSRNQNRVQGEKHESECNLRYTRIEEKLGEQKLSMKALDLKIWGLAVLIIIAPMVHKLLS
jgi:hypothetical protein